MSKLSHHVVLLPNDAAALGHAYANAKTNHLATATCLSSLKELGHDVHNTCFVPLLKHIAFSCTQVVQSFRQGRASEPAARAGPVCGGRLKPGIRRHTPHQLSCGLHASHNPHGSADSL